MIRITQKVSNGFKLALIASSISLVLGCSSSSDSPAAVSDAELTKSYVAASLSAVTLYASGPANCDTVTVGGKKTTFTGNDGVYMTSVKPSPENELVGKGCVDSATGKSVGTLKSEGSRATTVTTMSVNQMQAQVDALLAGVIGLDATARAAARASLAASLGMSEGELDDSPVANATLAKATAKVVATLKLLESAGVDPDAALALMSSNISTNGGGSLDTMLADPVFLATMPTTSGAPIDTTKVANIATATASIVAQTNSVDVTNPDAVKQLAAVTKVASDNAAAVADGTQSVDDLNVSMSAAAADPASAGINTIEDANTIVDAETLQSIVDTVAANAADYLSEADQQALAEDIAANNTTGGAGGTL